MTSHHDDKRWVVVAGALIIQISLGAVYIWSVFQTPLLAQFPSWSETQITLPAQLVIAVFAFAVILGGRIQDRLGPRLVGTLGGLILGLGLMLASLTDQFSDGTALAWLVGTYAVLGGIGIGMAYVCPVATCVKWYPDKRGLITGLAVAGFGAGAFFFAPLARALIGGGDYELFGIALFPLPQAGVFDTFLVLGVIFLTAVVLGAQLLRNPPEGYCPAGWTSPATASGFGTATGTRTGFGTGTSASAGISTMSNSGTSTSSRHTGLHPNQVDFTPGQMLRTSTFWLLWLTYLAGSTAGLMVIMKAAPIWEAFSLSAITERPVPYEQFASIASAAAMAVAVLALFNAAGRILWGRVSDSLGRKSTLILMFLLCGLVLFGLDWMRSYPLYLLGVSLIALCFGGFLALYPAITADYFGTRHIGVNYGLLFTSYGIGGLLGPFLAAVLLKTTEGIDYLALDANGTLTTGLFQLGDYDTAFLAAGLLCLAAAALSLGLRAPVASEVGEYNNISPEMA
ncbi:OFA family MFS transporter [Lamprobacter modestohalophilus]|uniref:OFA family MFS transporter n=1 Tax=Lamprobacter modestohalophilus TaxID=1064514 RepID=UPI002ADEA8AC|nr:OFA family MFS transporter [Lamprobacter modestohalophilus]MEA1052873.1 OFA family MFS transporter [Lamprobacter modestohalophilus]